LTGSEVVGHSIEPQRESGAMHFAQMTAIARLEINIGQSDAGHSPRDLPQRNMHDGTGQTRA